MKLIFKVIGILFFAFGFIYLAYNTAFVLTSKKEDARIVDILERKSGTNYESTKQGSIYPCKLRVKTDNKEAETLTLNGQEPCSELVSSYYKVGDQVQIYRNGKSTKLASDTWLFIVPFLVIIFGVLSVKFSNSIKK